MSNLVSIIMGSDSDLPVAEKGINILKELNIAHEIRVLSAHRTPIQLAEYVKQAEEKGTKVFIGVAGKAAHLPGVIASLTALPVIGLPIKTSDLGGIDSLLSIVQMPSGVPVATVGINAGENAALLAAQMLSISSQIIANAIANYRQQLEAEVTNKNQQITNI